MSIAYPPDREQSIHALSVLEKVQTIGYRQQDGLAEIERIMQTDPSTMLVDIRYSPRSQNLQWTKTAFSKKYKKRYLWIKALGNVKHHEKGNIQIADAQTGIEQLIMLLQDHSVLLMCGCENYEECHRKVVYELLESALNAEQVKATCFSTFYVDDIWEYPDCKLQSKKWCHLATNGSIDDLHAFAEKLQLKRSWFQDKPNHPHYDLTPGKRTQAMKHGAIAVDHLELVKICFPKLVEITSNVPQNIIDMFTQEEPAAPDFTPTELQPFPPGSLQERIFNDVLADRDAIHAENTRQRETIAVLTEKRQRTTRILKQLRQREQQTRAQIQARYHCTLDALLNGPATTVPLAAFNQEQEKRRQAEQEITIVNKLESNPKIKPGQEKFIRHVINASKYGKYQDPDGRTRINLKGIAERMGMSSSTAQRGIQFCEKQLPQLFDIASYTEPAPNGIDETTRYYAKVKPEAMPHLDTIEPLDFRKQGGDKTICALCGGKHVRVKVERKRILICDDCNRENPPTIDITESYEYPNADYQKEDAAAYIASRPKGVQNEAIIITSDPPTVCADNIPAAAKLLLAIAGTHGQHIEMSRDGEKKYYSVDRPLSLADLENHLKGGKARGSLCSHPEGKTRALCFDADDIDGWTVLQDAAKRLAEAGYIPLLEESPADRGGHLWLISDNMINGDVAREHAYQIAPDLKQIIEYWPAPLGAKNWNRVRLPGAYYCRIGKYVEHDVKGWCKIVNVASGESSHDGESAAALLLGSLTPVEVMAPKNLPPDDHDYKQEPEARIPATPAIEQPLSTIEQELGYKLPVVDEKWEKEHGKVTETTLYFAVMPNYAAECYNREHRLEEIHPLETNGMALSPNGQERTASTNYHETESGERYTDHSQHGRRADGTRDTGDALELAAKVQGTPKPELLRMSTGQIVKKARADLEAAAKNGQDIPHWLEYPVCIITPAGRRHYTFELGKRKNGQRRSPDQLGAGSNNVPESTRSGISVSTPVRAENRDTGSGILEPIRQVSRNSIVEIGDRGTERGDSTTQENTPNTTEVIKAERVVKQSKSKIGVCLVEDHKTGKACGSRSWIPNTEEEYVCFKCYSPIGWSRKIEAEHKLSCFPTHDNR